MMQLDWRVVELRVPSAFSQRPATDSQAEANLKRVATCTLGVLICFLAGALAADPPEQPADPVPLLRLRHDKPATGVAFLEGPRLVTACSDGSVRLWDGTDGRQLKRLIVDADPGPGDGVRHLLSSKDRKAVIISTPDTLQVWEASLSKRLWQFKREDPNPLFWQLALAPDGKTVAVPCLREEILLFDFSSGALKRVFKRPGMIQTCTFSPDGKSLAGTYSDGKTVLWDVEKGVVAGTFGTPNGENMEDAVFLKDGKVLVALSNDGVIRLWDVEKCVPLYALRHVDAMTLHVVDHENFLSVDTRGIAVQWNVAKAARIRSIRVGEKQILAVAFSPDGRRVAIACESGDVNVFDCKALGIRP